MIHSQYPIVKKGSSIQEAINHLISSRSKLISRFNYLIKVELNKENICQSSLDLGKLGKSITELDNSMNSYILVIDKKIQLLYNVYCFLCKQSEPMNPPCNRCFNNCCCSYDTPHAYRYSNDYGDYYSNQRYRCYNPYYYNQYPRDYDDPYPSYYYPYYYNNYPNSRYHYCNRCWGRS